MKTIIVNSPQSKRYLFSLVEEMPEDGTKEVILKNVDMSSTAKQRRLRWMWNDEVSRSGLGRHDTKIGVDLAAKWQFARPILLRDDEMFSAIYSYFMDTVRGADAFSEYCKKFTEQYISIERMNKAQVVEYLKEFQRFWVSKGVRLTDPELQGLNLNKLAKRYKEEGYGKTNNP